MIGFVGMRILNTVGHGCGSFREGMAAPEAALVGGGVDCLRTRTETGEQLTMTNKQPARVLDALMYEVLKTTTMLLFLLSGISMNRRKQYEAPGVARPFGAAGTAAALSLPVHRRGAG